jgi:hypothetical protein
MKGEAGPLAPGGGREDVAARTTSFVLLARIGRAFKKTINKTRRDDCRGSQLHASRVASSTLRPACSVVLFCLNYFSITAFSSIYLLTRTDRQFHREKLPLFSII